MGVKLNFKNNTTVYVSVEYSIGGLLEVELPDGRTWDDVDEFWVKWDTAHILFKDGTKFEDEIGTDAANADYKRPLATQVHPQEKYDYGLDCNWNVTLAEE